MATRTIDPKCGKSWTGLKPEHCTVCHETFSGTTAGDAHRAGPHSARYCREPAEAGLVRNAKGYWTRPTTDADWSRVWDLSA